MDVSAVKTSVTDACCNYKKNDAKFYCAMHSFYKEGKKNPSVARIILQDHIYKGQKIAGKMMNDAVSFSQSDIPAILYPEFSSRLKQIYNISSAEALRSIAVADIYKETKYISDNLGFQNRKEFDESWDKNYPKTGDIRKRIIEANRITMDGVTRKADWFEKINYAKTVAEYKKDYPKTFFARYSLIINGQIDGDSVSSRAKGWLSRFTYKSLIKGKFCFKK